MSELAFKLIAENKKTHAPFLDLGNCGLTAIPEELGELTWLEGLSFASRRFDFNEEDWGEQKTKNTGSLNKLSSLYANDSVALKTKSLVNNTTQLNPISNLTNLKKLWVSGNYGTKFGLSDLTPLSNLLKLQQLYVSNTYISDLTLLSGLPRLQQLDISATRVIDLTPLSDFSGLQQLDISDTKVSDLKPLSHLSNLQSLSAWDTQVSDLTPLSGLSRLQMLDVSRTAVINFSKAQVSDLTPLIGLSELKELDVSYTKVSDLTPLAGLSGLQELDVSYAKVCDLTPLSGFSSLRELDVSYTQISDLTPLSNLCGLRELDVSHTKVSDLAPLSDLSGLQKINISNTQVSDLSPLLKLIITEIEVYWSTSSWQGNWIYLENCPLTNPPTEVVKKGNPAIINYFYEKETQGVDHLYEAKMLIIGEGGAGKTSLLRRLYQSDPLLPEENESTQGIDIVEHEFTMDNGRNFRLNVWDFGGQEIYHATHQFFLTKRSLYVLLDDTRKDYQSVHDEGFKYWLEVVDLLGDHSPVLIFQNEKRGRSKTIDESGIKGKFDNVKEFYRGNLEEPHSVDDIRQAIELFVQQLPHIGDELPAKWVSIRADIETLAKEQAYISRKAYFDIYRKHLEFDREKALFLSDYLHDLGAFLHFQDDPLLTRTVILQNRWATEGVFKILDDETVKANWGHFDAADCKRLWKDSDYADMHLELLALMQKFELCYRLPDQAAETWLAPQLLSPSRPEQMQDWAEPGDLVLRYCYEFLPKGMISRLLVRMHRFVIRPDFSWSTGVLFERDETALLAEIPQKGGEIVLHSRGLERKELLSVISADLDALNASFHNLPAKIKKLVPCVCSCCRELTEPEFFEQKRLLRRKEHGKLKVECPTSFEYVDVLQLLDGIRMEQLPGWAEDESKKNDRTIKIFLASSSELEQERDEFDLFFRQQNDLYRKRGIYLEIIRWESFLDTMSETRLQDEYNKKVRTCDIFVSLFFTKTGKFTEEEFDTAYQQFMKTGKPKIYTFFKTEKTKLDFKKRKDINSLWDFQHKLSELGHFHTEYNDIEHLKRLFKDQLEKLFDQVKLGP